MNCQQIYKISRKKDLIEVKIFQKVLGGYYFLKHPVETRLCRESANLRQGQSLNEKWSEMRIPISGLIRIRIQMSAGSVQKCNGFILLSVSVISHHKIGGWLYAKC